MKKGKTSKLNVFDDAKCYYGTVDSKNFKSVYIILQTWIEPIQEDQNWTKLIGEIKRQIQHTLLEVVDNQTFERKQIVDLDLRTSGIQKNKICQNSKKSVYLYIKTRKFYDYNSGKERGIYRTGT